MNSLGLFNWLAPVLQLGVPYYGLRLNRLFGPRRVGWFLVAALSALALMRWLESVRPWYAGGSPSATLNVVYTICCLLLLVGMGHMETLFTERVRAEREEAARRGKLETELKRYSAELDLANERLRAEVSHREQTERALRASENRYVSLFSENPQPIWIFDRYSLQMLAVNKAALSRYGFTAEEFMALSPGDIFAPDEVSTFLSDATRSHAGVQSQGLWRHYRKDGTLMDVQVTAVDFIFDDHPARLMLAQDVTQRRRREVEFREAQKLEALVQLAGGVAHHFNNILTAITCHTNLLLQKDHPPATLEQLALVSTATHRAAGLTQQLLAFSGRQMMRPERLDLNGLVKGLSEKVQHLLGRHIRLRLFRAPGLPLLMGDPRLLESLILNLVLNARDAMSGGGTLTLSTAVVQVDALPTRCEAEGRTGEFVRLSVQDTGSGMAAEAQAHLFEPFFSTKGVGKGAGLGLAAAYGISRQHGGWIGVTSEPGIGTEVQVFLPVAPRLAVTPADANTQGRGDAGAAKAR